MSEQIKITVIEEADRGRSAGKESGGKETVLFHDAGKTLLHTLREGGIQLPSLCGSIGKCGRCQVKFHGQAPLPSPADRAIIAPDKLREGYRLACMVRPRKSITVETAFGKEAEAHVVVGSSAEEGWKDSSCGKNDVGSERFSGRNEWQGGGSERFNGRDTGQGNSEGKYRGRKGITEADMVAAVDIGTTTIAMQLMEAESGQVLDTYTCLNPQRSYGADVISRIRAGTEGEGGRMKRLVREALAAGLEHMLGGNVQNGNALGEEAGNGSALGEEAWTGKSGKPKLMVISANTVMGHLFMGYPVETLGRSPFLPVNMKTVSLDFLGIPTILIPGISAFVGGDIVSGLYACGLYPYRGAMPEMPMEDAGKMGEPHSHAGQKQREKAWLFLDLGTNAEMVIGKGNRIACTSAAAGPAFEGRGRQGRNGSERIEAIAFLLEKGIIDRGGLLKDPYFETGIEVELEDKKGKIRVFQEDIRDIQMAKAAVRAGIYFLMKRMGIKDADEIERVYVAGGFGFYLKREAAVEIGLVPAGLGEKMEAVGNTSLAGAKLMGMKGLLKDMEAEALAKKAEAFQLADEPLFEEKYIEYMNF